MVHQNLTRQNPKHFLWIRYSRILNPSNKNNTEIKGYCLLCYLLGLPVLLVLSSSSIRRCLWVPFSLTASDIEAVYATSQRKSTTLMPQLHRPISLYKIYKNKINTVVTRIVIQTREEIWSQKNRTLANTLNKT